MGLTTATMPKDEAHGNPFEIWDGPYLCALCLTFATFCSSKGMFKNFIRGVGVDKPSPKASLEKQTLTSEGLEEKKL